MAELHAITFLLNWLILQGTIAAAPPVCQNNGTLNKGVCTCPANLEGKHCEFYTPKVTTDTIVVATLVITEFNGTYIEEYKHPESSQYQEFAQNFTNNMNEVYRSKVENYTGLKILKIRDGSIVVTHEVMVNITNGKNTTEMVKKIPKQIKDALNYTKKCKKGSEGCPTMTLSAGFFVDESEFHPNLVCEQNIPKEFRIFYTGVETAEEIFCISQCHELHNNTKNCSSGTCRVMSTGTTCQCEGGFLYTGNDCHGQMNRNAEFAAIGTVAGALVVTLVVLVVCLLMNKQSFVRMKESKDDQVNQWQEDDFASFRNQAS